MFAKYHQTVEILITAANANGINVQIPFPQQPQLQSYNVEGQKVYIHAIESYSNTALTSSPLSPGVNVATPFDLQNAALTLVEGNAFLRRSIPLTRLNNAWATGPNFMVPYQTPIVWADLFEVDWTKCYINIFSIPPVLPFSYVFSVYYDYSPATY
jgi:hypothetical protein